MRIPRLYYSEPLTANTCLSLNSEMSHYLITVLRLKPAHPLILFNDNYTYQALIAEIHKKTVHVEIQASLYCNLESPLSIQLGQVISKSEAMDYSVQKSVELGVGSIQPLFSSRCEINLNPEHLAKKLLHWQKIALHACEQCGRNRIPIVYPAIGLETWLKNHSFKTGIILDPLAPKSLKDLELAGPIGILIGPEGGLSPDEIALAKTYGLSGISMGPRILRTETAVVAALSAIQILAGDLI